MTGPGYARPPGPSRLRLFSEDVPWPALDPALLATLASRRVELLVAVTPERLRDVPDLARRAADAGAAIGWWPLLHDVAGRYPNAEGIAPFGGLVRRLLAALPRPRGDVGGPPTLVVDLEPPLSVLRMRRFHRDDRRMLRRWLAGAFRQTPAARRRLRRLVSDARARGAGEVIATVMPPVVLATATERPLGTPVRRVGFDAVFPMAYTSLAEGYVPGLGRTGATAALGWVARRARGTVALGLVGGGALGDERAYRGPEELAEDVAIARAAGAWDVAVHGLDGMLARPPLARWLEAMDG